MRPIAFQFLAAVSLLSLAAAATRPHYGGTLRVTLQSARNTLDVPANADPGVYWDSTRVLALLTDNLVKINPQGKIEPALAVSWQSDSTAKHWQFTLRPGIKFHDGSTMSAGAVAQILGPLHSGWNVRGSGVPLRSRAAIPCPACSRNSRCHETRFSNTTPTA
jgi:ABC-type transport system substrate-binding protein